MGIMHFDIIFNRRTIAKNVPLDNVPEINELVECQDKEYTVVEVTMSSHKPNQLFLKDYTG